MTMAATKPPKTLIIQKAPVAVRVQGNLPLWDIC